MKIYKLMFFITMILGTLISISSYSWLGMWMGLEINMISIIPMFAQYKNMYSSEAAMKYFLTQAMASMMILFGIILMSINFMMFMELNMNFYMNLIISSALLTKMGAAPFHFWFPEVIEGLNWFNSLILLTWQKIAPMILIMYNSYMNMFYFMIILMSMIISSIMGFNQTSLRKILAYSSINHIGWMISALLYSKLIWLIYFLIYSLISINIIFIFNKFKLYFISQLILIFNQTPLLKTFFMLNFLSLGGIPPFLGFFPKWLVIYSLISNKNILLPFIMIIFTLMTFYFYLRLMFSALIINFNTQIPKSNNLNYFYMMICNWLFLFGLILFPVFLIMY
nr:NADH dehydrogenase subunit 2 [Tillus discoidalis]WIL79900.1 NADH dehydrogenase subunit 2 [Opilo sinensis]